MARQARRGPARHGLVRRGLARQRRQGGAGHVKERLGMARQARRGAARHGPERSGVAGKAGKERRGVAWLGTVWQGRHLSPYRGGAGMERLGKAGPG